jgi:FtsP/CotA-like multicopper oxidase with cupredoxin domain
MVNRRELLRALGAGALTGAGAALGWRPDALHAIAAVPQVADPDVELDLVAAPDRVAILSGAPTEVWRYTVSPTKGPPGTVQALPGSYLGPVLRLRRGQRVRVRFQNRLPEPSIVHWHGLDVPDTADGHPRFAVGEGASYVYEFEVRNRAGTYWFHPHSHHRTGAQVYRGLAGVIIVSDDEEAAAALPTGAQDMVFVLQDRSFDAGNQLAWAEDMMTQRHGFLGQRVLVNGRASSRGQVATRAYRLRLLNGSNSRVYSLQWSDDTPLMVIGSDGGLLERPVRQSTVTLAPAQRVEIIADFRGRAPGSTIELRSAPFPGSEVDPAAASMGGMGGMAGMRGMGGGTGAETAGRLPLGAPLTLMTFEIARREDERFVLPDRLSTFDASWSAPPDLAPRRVEISFAAGQWLLAGRTFEMMDVAPEEHARAGGSQIWDVANVGGMMGFRVLSRTRSGATPVLAGGLVDTGWLDTVLVLPGETLRLQTHFSDYTGLFLYHCHTLAHEDLGMMRNYRLVAG